eukprot:4221769-Prymnesium_polylepis.1
MGCAECSTTPPPPSVPAVPPLPGRFATSESEVRTFTFTPARRSVQEAFDQSPNHATEWAYSEIGGAISRSAVIDWVERELLGGPNPFASHGSWQDLVFVPVPWP